MSENLIEVKKLVTQFSGKNGTVTAVDGVSFHVKRGKAVRKGDASDPWK